MEGTGRSGGSDRTINARTPSRQFGRGRSASLLCGHLASGNMIVVDEVSGRAAWNRIELPGDDGPDFESGTSAIVVVLETRCSDT